MASAPNPTEARTAIAAADLRSGYGSLEVLHGLGLTVRSGEIFAVLGRNGMGKTTLLKTIIGLIPMRTGALEVLGRDLTGVPAYRRARIGMAYIPQDKALFPDLTVAQNLRLGLSRPREFSRQLQHVGELFPVLPTRLRQRAGTLSGGEQKMLCLARAIMSEPQVMIVDEISEGLQPSMRTVLIQALLSERERRQTTILLVEQNLEFAFALADRYAVMKSGGFVATGAASVTAKGSVSSQIAL